MIVGRAAPLPDGSLGYDLTAQLNAASVRQYLNKSARFVIRYIGREDGSHTFTDLSHDEASTIVNLGLALGVVQHPLQAGWHPTLALGKSFGAAAARLCGAASLPEGITVWLDLEGVASGAPAQDVIDYCNAWHDQVTAVGYNPGVYIGANPGLTADQLYWDIRITNYWRGGSSEKAGVPADIPNRGYQMTQRITVQGHSEIDTDVVSTDRFGGKVMWCVT